YMSRSPASATTVSAPSLVTVIVRSEPAWATVETLPITRQAALLNLVEHSAQVAQVPFADEVVYEPAGEGFALDLRHGAEHHDQSVWPQALQRLGHLQSVLDRHSVVHDGHVRLDLRG